MTEYEAAPYYYLESDGELVYCAPWFRKEGLCFFCYNDLELAISAAEAKSRSFGYDINLAETDTIIEYCIRMADRGFAGAVLNDLIPILFCSDETGNFKTIRMIRGATGDDGHFEVLIEDGTWSKAAPDEKIIPLCDQPRFDRLIQELVGVKPFRGYAPDWQASTYSTDGTDQIPCIEFVSSESAGKSGERSFIPIFSSLEHMESFVVGRGLDPSSIYRRVVRNLPALADHALSRGSVILLNPGQHRMEMAAIARTGDTVALTGYSGKWISEDGQVFRPSGGQMVRSNSKNANRPDGVPRTLAEELAEAQDGEEPDGEDRRDDGPDSLQIPKDLAEVDFDLTKETVELRVEREEVESGRFTVPLSYFCSAFKDRDSLTWAAGRFQFTFPDLDEENEFHRNEPVRDWLRALDRVFPVLLYFLSPLPGGLADVTAAMLNTVSQGEDEIIDTRELSGYVEDRCLMILSMGLKYSVDCRDVCTGIAEALSVELPDGFFLHTEAKRDDDSVVKE